MLSMLIQDRAIEIGLLIWLNDVGEAPGLMAGISAFIQVQAELILDLETLQTLIFACQRGVSLSSTFLQLLVQAVFNLH